MGFKNYYSNLKSTSEAVEQLFKNTPGENPDLILVHATVNHDFERLRRELVERFPASEIAGVTSFMGILTQEGFVGKESWGLTVTCYSSEDFNCGVAIGDHKDGEEAGKEAVKAALYRAEREATLPDFVIMYSNPGKEEGQLRGIFKYLGCPVPLSGASAGDTLDGGSGYIFDKYKVTNRGVLVVACFTRSMVTSFLSGYKPTGHYGVITQVQGRKILEIDHRKASDVYDEWSREVHDMAPSDPGLHLSTINNPLGRELTQIGGMPFFLMSQPLSVGEEGGINFLSEFKVGEKIHLMSGSEKSMLERTPKIIHSLMVRENLDTSDIDGCVIVFCAGYLLRLIETQLFEEVAQMIKEELPGVPFTGMFSFGEQGVLLDEEARHGNLMISVTLFKKGERLHHDF